MYSVCEVHKDVARLMWIHTVHKYVLASFFVLLALAHGWCYSMYVFHPFFEFRRLRFVDTNDECNSKHASFRTKRILHCMGMCFLCFIFGLAYIFRCLYAIWYCRMTCALPALRESDNACFSLPSPPTSTTIFRFECNGMKRTLKICWQKKNWW